MTNPTALVSKLWNCCSPATVVTRLHDAMTDGRIVTTSSN